MPALGIETESYATIGSHMQILRQAFPCEAIASDDGEILLA